MNYQSAVEVLGIGLAHRIMEDSLSESQFDALTFAQKREVYGAERSFDKQMQILKRMLHQVSSVKELLWLFGESAHDVMLRKIIFEKLMSRDLSVSMLKRLYARTIGDDEKVIIARKIRGAAKTVEHLISAHDRLTWKSVPEPDSSKTSEAEHYAHLRSQDARIDACQGEKAEIFAQAVEVFNQKPTLADFRLLVQTAINPDERKFGAAILKAFDTIPLSFGELYKLLDGCKSFDSIFYKHIDKRLRGATIAPEDVLTVLSMRVIHMGMDEVIAKKIRESEFDLAALKMIYKASRGAWDAVNDVVVAKIKTIVAA